jgi:hypothetical protein
MQDYDIRLGVYRFTPPSDDPANLIGSESHAIGCSDPAHHGFVRRSSADAAQLALVGLYHGAHLVHDDPILGREGVDLRPCFG